MLYAVATATSAVLLAGRGPISWSEIGPALALQALVGVLLALSVHRGREIPFAGPLGIIAYLVSVALLRDGAGPTVGYGVLVMLPVAWSALRGRRTETAVAIIGVAVIYLAPIAVVGPPRYPAGQWQAGVMFFVIAAGLGITLMQLVSRVQRLMQQLQALARTDELTGVANRRAWTETLQRELAFSRRGHHPVSVAILDFDHFKRYNDAHGHPAADRMLRSTVAAWGEALRETDVLGRWGGDEFVLLLPSCDAGCAVFVIERLRAAAPGASFSAGLVEASEDSTADSLIAEADIALYQAKRSGRMSTAISGKVELDRRPRRSGISEAIA
jgi:diguanylate cyclase (GGDEF)-like protein